jgi:hypothetical protein
MTSRRADVEELSRAYNRRLPALTIAMVALFVTGPAAAAEKSTELTGCVDERPGPTYVLRGDQQLRLIALLEPEGFPVQGFAKYLGHKVVVTGQLSSNVDPPVMKVKRVKRVASYCAPASAEPTGKTASQSKDSDSRRLSAPKKEIGCIDEQPGPRYVLRGDRELRVLLHLEPEGFPIEGFAKYLGYKVEVHGRTYAEDGRTSMRVTEVRRLSGVCAPQ